jgi:RNA polymerase sigma-70 factor (ECF subfamily)
VEDWSRIVAQHSQAAWQLAYRMLGNEADAADCLQEAFAVAVRLSRRQPVRSWAGLLRRVVTMQALDRLRQRVRRRRFDGVADLPEIPDPASGPVEQAQAGELAESLRKALAQLPTQQAAVFCLRFLDDRTYEQIAELLSLETTHVGVLLHRARAALRELLAVQDARDKAEVRHD